MMTYKTTGTCSREINFDIDEVDGVKVVRNVSFVGGCNGNLKGIGKLVEVIRRLEGTICGMKGTSCPDQLATALKSI